MSTETMEVIESQMVKELAEKCGISYDEAFNLILKCKVSVNVRAGNAVFTQTTLPGHIYGKKEPGPAPADVMLLLGHPGFYDVSRGLHLSDVDGSRRELEEACRLCNLDPSSWYVTSVVKFAFPQNRKEPLKDWFVDCLPLLQKEIELVQPKVILASGRHPFAALFGNKVKLTNARGTTLQYQGISVVPVLSPGAVVQSPTNKPAYQNDMLYAASVIHGRPLTHNVPTVITLVNSVEKLWKWVEDVKHLLWFAVDVEADGLRPRVGGLRTIQVCHEAGQVAVFHMRNERMEVVLDEEEVAKALRVVLCKSDARIIGHNGRFDIRWLRCIGVNCLPNFIRGFDTILAHHALYPTDEQQLEIVCNKLLGPDRYDLLVRKWADEHRADVERNGYGHVPDDILIPYGARDADKTFQLALVLLRMLQQPENQCLYRLVTEVALPANAGIIEMEESGLRVDLERYEWLEEAYKAKHTELLAKVRAELKWEDFNPASWQQKNELLFGEKYNGQQFVDGKPVKIRPSQVECLNATPTKTTGKPPVMWEDVIANNEEDKYTPSSDGETLSYLATDYPILALLRDERYLAKAINGFMPDAKNDPGGEQFYSSGIRGWMWPDGRVRTHISQLAETGRWRSSDPNMQNF